MLMFMIGKLQTLQRRVRRLNNGPMASRRHQLTFLRHTQVRFTQSAEYGKKTARTEILRHRVLSCTRETSISEEGTEGRSPFATQTLALIRISACLVPRILANSI